MLEARLRGQGGRFLGPAQNADEASHLGKGLAARLLDDLEALPLRLLVGLQPAAAHAPDGASHPRKGPAARLLDDLERLTFLLLVGLQPAADHARLHGHDAHAVPDDVVQLAWDPGALLGEGRPRVGLPLALELLGPLLWGPAPLG